MNFPRNATQLEMTSCCSDLRTEPYEQIGYDYPEEPAKMSSESGDSFSEFGEGSCGEPQSVQHLVIDFTHNEIDNEFVQKKCCAFWEFIESHPEIHHLMVMPDSQIYPSTPTSTDDTTPLEDVFPSEIEEEPVIKEHTAVSMLDFVSREGLIDKSFEAKIPQTFCPLGSREYLENEPTHPKPSVKKTHAVKNVGICPCNKEPKCCKKVKLSEVAPASSEKVRSMCESMRKWDLHHPKSMEPPGHALPLIHAVMQRKVN